MYKKGNLPRKLVTECRRDQIENTEKGGNLPPEIGVGETDAGEEMRCGQSDSQRKGSRSGEVTDEASREVAAGSAENK